MKLLAIIRIIFLLYTALLLAIPRAYAAADDMSYTVEDFSAWLEAAKIAQVSYQSKHEIETELNRQGYELKSFQQIPGYSVAYIYAVNHESRQTLITVRGTSNIENAVVDAAFVLVPDKITGVDIHQGFLLSARDIYMQLKPEVDPSYTVNTIGHSLGGAAALILAMMFDAQGYEVGKVITFGQPKVTNISGSRKFRHLDVTRLVTPKDIVPLVPPMDPMDMMNFSIFWHQGTEVLLYPDQRYSVLSGMKSMMRAADFLNDVPSQRHLSDHFMTTYIRHLEKKIPSNTGTAANGSSTASMMPENTQYISDFSFSDLFGGDTASPANQ